jgi:tetratricopeptide (TPR) repeat protein
VGQPRRAVADLTEAIRINPEDGIAWYWRGVAYQTLMQVDTAMADYSRSLQLSPDLSLAYSARGGLWKDKGDLPRAINDLDRAIALDPNAVDAYCMRGDAMYSQGDFDKALKDFDAVVQVAPDSPVGYCLRAQALVGKGDFQRALNDANRAIRIDRGLANAYCVRGTIYARSGKPDSALSEFAAALRLSPGFAPAHLGLAFVYHDKGMYEQALAEMDNASRADQELSWALGLHRAWMLATCPNRGIRNGRKALEVASDCYQKIGALASPANAFRSAACVVLAAASAEAGDFTSAVQWQKRSIEAHPRMSARPGAGTVISPAWIESVLTLYRANTPYRESESDVRRGFVQNLRALVPLPSFTVESVRAKR